MNSSHPPLVLRLAAALLIVFGAASIVSMVASIFRGSLSLELGFVGIPIGRGLLIGRHSSRSWAIGLSGFSLILVCSIIGWGFCSGQFHATKREHVVLSGVYCFLVILVSATVFFGLRSASVRAWFDADSADRGDGFGWTAPLVIIGALFATTTMVRDYIVETSLAGLFPIHTEFQFRDANAGGQINSVGISFDGQTLSASQRNPLAPRISSTTRGSSDGISVVVKGFSGRPVDVTFTSEGYLPARYTLDEKSPKKVNLPLQISK